MSLPRVFKRYAARIPDERYVCFEIRHLTGDMDVAIEAQSHLLGQLGIDVEQPWLPR